jgi:hypothetical protein
MESVNNFKVMLSTFFEDHLASVIAATLVFFIGLVVLFVLLSILKKLLLKPLGLNRLFAKFTGRVVAPFDLEKVILRIFFFTGFLLILSSVAQVAGMNYFIDLFDSIFVRLGVLFTFALRALFPIVLALVFSHLAKIGVLWIGTKFKLDERVGKKLDAGEPVNFSITKSLSEITYGVVFLYFVPQIFVGLGLEQLSEPITNMFAGAFSFIPRLITSVIIIVIFWFVAKILRQVLEGILKSFGVDALQQKFLGDNFLGSLKLSKLLPAIVYAIIIGLAFIEALRRLRFETITAPLERLIENAVNGLPSLLAAIFIIAIAVFLGRLISNFVSGLLKDVGFDGIYSSMGLTNVRTGTQTPSAIIGHLVYYGIIFLAVLQALEILGLTNLSDILETLIYRIFDVAVGVFVFGIGLFIAKKLALWVEQATHASYSKLLALIVKVVVIAIATAMALQQVGIADEIVKIAFALAMGSIALGVAIAIGLGGKDTAGEIVKKFVSKFNG